MHGLKTNEKDVKKTYEVLCNFWSYLLYILTLNGQKNKKVTFRNSVMKSLPEPMGTGYAATDLTFPVPVPFYCTRKIEKVCLTETEYEDVPATDLGCSI